MPDMVGSGSGVCRLPEGSASDWRRKEMKEVLPLLFVPITRMLDSTSQHVTLSVLACSPDLLERSGIFPPADSSRTAHVTTDHRTGIRISASMGHAFGT